MELFGKIERIELKKKGTSRNGNDYETYTIYFKCGDDVHMPTYTVYPTEQTGRQLLQRRGIAETAVGNMEIRYGRGDFEGRSYPTVELKSFKEYGGRQQSIGDNIASAAHDVAAHAVQEPSLAEVAASFAEAAQSEKIDPSTCLPY